MVIQLGDKVKYILTALIGALLANFVWAGLWYTNILPNRMTGQQYIHYRGERTPPPAISINGYSAESDFDAILANEVLRLKSDSK